MTDTTVQPRSSAGQLELAIGTMPDSHQLPEPYPYGTVDPDAEGIVSRDGVGTWYGQYGTDGPWLVFAPIYQIANSYMLRGVVPYLSQHFRVLVMDLRGSGRSDRPSDPAAYDVDNCYADFVAVLNAVGVDSACVVGISMTAMHAVRLAAEQPARVSHLMLVGAELALLYPGDFRLLFEANLDTMRSHWDRYLGTFFGRCLNEPHSTKPIEDAALAGWGSDGDTIAKALAGWEGVDHRPLARSVACPTMVIHGDRDLVVPWSGGAEIADLIPHAEFVTVGSGGHLMPARDPIAFARLVESFTGSRSSRRTWTRAIARPPRVLFVSSAIGLGHVQRDLAIARELRAQRSELQIEWFTVEPAATYLLQEGETLHPATRLLANESRHFEQMAGEHDLHAFFALRTMDEVMARNFLVLQHVLDEEHFDLIIGDEAWEVDHHLHENPELKRQPFVFLTDFVGSLPVTDDEREAYLCADRNADEIEHVERYPWIRDRSLFVGNADDLPDVAFGPGLPNIRAWTTRNFAFTGYTLPFDPQRLADIDAVRVRHGYRPGERLIVAAVGGTSVGGSLLRHIADAFPIIRRECPDARMVLVAGPRVDPGSLPEHDGLEVRTYVHNLFEHLACADLALVQGGLSTCMELVATKRPFLSFPLAHHFEQNIHVRNRLRNYGADNSVELHETSAQSLAERALQTMHAPVSYRAVETDGATRAASHILSVLENRSWATA